MKKILTIAIMMTGLALSGRAQWVPHYYLKAEQMPDATLFLPTPPEPGSALFENDSLVYEQGKLMRHTQRGEQAVADTSLFVSYFMQRFGEAAGLSLTPEEYPELAEFLDASYTTIRLAIAHAKEHYARHRPYQHFGEPTPVPNQEDSTDYTSYPSGHTVRAWGAALVMVSVDPEHQDAYLKAGYEMGQSRTIVGYHYQSDIDAARLAASTGFARLTADKQWQKDLKKVRREFRRMSRTR